MSNDHDPVISRLFAERDQSFPSDDFALNFGERMDRHQRTRSTFRVLAIVASLVLITLTAPWIAQIMSTLIELTAAGMSIIGRLFYLPLTWLLVGATAAGCSPVIYLWRTDRW